MSTVNLVDRQPEVLGSHTSDRQPKSLDRYLVVSCGQITAGLGISSASLELDMFQSERLDRTFQLLIEALEDFCPHLEPISLGVCAMKARGPTRYFGGEHRLCELIHERISRLAGDRRLRRNPGLELKGISSVGLGIANGLWAARLAVTHFRSPPCELGRFVDNNYRGITSIVPSQHATKFLMALKVDVLEDTALCNSLKNLGIYRLEDFARLSRGDIFSRFGKEALLAHEMVTGLRGHIPGTEHRYLSKPKGSTPSPAKQLGFWGELETGRSRAARCLEKLESKIGPEKIFMAALEGGRTPRELHTYLPWRRLQDSSLKIRRNSTYQPWPGGCLYPLPSIVMARPVPLDLLGPDRQPVYVTRRSMLSASPRYISINRSGWQEVLN